MGRAIRLNMPKRRDEEPIAVKSPNCRGRPKKTKSRNLLERMQRHKESILLFVLKSFY